MTKASKIFSLPEGEKRLNAHFGGTRRQNMDSWALLLTVPEFIEAVRSIRKAFNKPTLTWDVDAFDKQIERNGSKFVTKASHWVEGLKADEQEAFKQALYELLISFQIPKNHERTLEEFVLYDTVNQPPFYNSYTQDVGITDDKAWAVIKVFAWLDPRYPEAVITDLQSRMTHTLKECPSPTEGVPVFQIAWDEKNNILEIFASCENKPEVIKKFVPKVSKRVIELSGSYFARHDYLENPAKVIATVETMRKKLGKPGSENMSDLSENYFAKDFSDEELADDKLFAAAVERSKREHNRLRQVKSRYKKSIKKRFGRDTKI